MDSANTSTPVLQSKPHLEILDGLRGVAAIAVVVFHFMEYVTPDFKDNFIAHGYLAVDFFFCLSGFVIAYAYDYRIKYIGLKAFFKLRLIRLHPLVVIGSVIGVLVYLFDPFINLYAIYGARKTGLLFMASSLSLPYPSILERYFNNFPLNPPTWSLFWEYIANIFYALILFKLSNKILWLLIVVAAILLSYFALQAPNLVGGWNGETFWVGGSRVFYSFLAGMLICRFNWVINSNLGFISMGLLLLAAFLFPYSEKINWLADLLLIVFYFPFLVALGAGVKSANQFSSICKFSGAISYPLYMIHYPFLFLYGEFLVASKPTLAQTILVITIGTIFLITIAYIVMVYLDAPIRKFLKNKIL